MAGRHRRYDLETPLSRALMDVRMSAGLSGQALADQLGCSQARISRFETGMVVPDLEEIKEFLVACKAEGGTQEKVLRLRSDQIFAFAKGHGEKLDVVKIQEEVGRLVASVDEILSFSDCVVPGLLQTAEYTAALFRVGGVLDTRALQKAVAVRQEWRRAALKKASALRFVIGEAATRRPFGGALPEQMESLANDAKRKNVDIRYLSNDSPTGVIPMHFFSVFGEELVMVETFTRTLIMRDTDEIKYYRDVFGRLSKDAVPIETTVEISGKAELPRVTAK